MLVKEMDLHEDMLVVLEAHQREYHQGKGVWKRVDYTDDVFILVREKRMFRTKRYRVFLVEVKTERFVSVMLLDPEKISGNEEEVFYTPTSFIIPEYQGRGLFMPIYRWLVDNNINLKADRRQSEFSNRLWHRLITEYNYLSIRDDRQISEDSYIDMLNVERLRQKEYTTLLFGNDWTESCIKQFASKITEQTHGKTNNKLKPKRSSKLKPKTKRKLRIKSKHECKVDATSGRRLCKST